jgi:ATP-dependent helicase/nuclease subunit B
MALDLPPAVEPLRRLATLALLILRAGDAFGEVLSLDQAWPLARALAELMDDAEWAECDLAETLPLAADGDFAEHWRETLRFLSIVTSVWPAWLAEQGVMNPAARQVALLRAQAALARGAGCGIAFVGRGIYRCGAGRARCAGCGAGPGRGRLVLPWVDLSLDEAIWVALPDGHPQAGLARLLGGLERTRPIWRCGRRRCRCPARRRGAGCWRGRCCRRRRWATGCATRAR